MKKILIGPLLIVGFLGTTRGFGAPGGYGYFRPAAGLRQSC